MEILHISYIIEYLGELWMNLCRSTRGYEKIRKIRADLQSDYLCGRARSYILAGAIPAPEGWPPPGSESLDRGE